jgi:hypothetical protein
MEILMVIYMILSPFLMALSIIDINLIGLKLSTVIPLIIWLSALIFLLFRIIITGKLKIDVSAILLGAFFVLSALKYTLDSNGSNNAMLFVSFTWVILYFIGYNINFNNFNQASILQIIQRSSLIAIILGIILYQLNIPLYSADYVGTDRYFSIGDKYRATGTFVNPNAFAYFILFYFIMIYRSKDKYYYIKLIVVVYALLITYSRSALAIFIIIFLINKFIEFLGYLKSKSSISKKKYALFALSPILLSVATILFFINSNYIANDILRIEDIINNERWQKWVITYDFIFTNVKTLIVGNNLNLYIQSGVVSFSDNQYLYFLVYYGFFGCILLFLFYFKTFFSALNGLTENKIPIRVKNARGAKLDILIIFALMALVSNIALIFPITFYVPLIIGFLNNYEKKEISFSGK